jgi:NADH-quinone oxidoreductase subunit J
MAETSTLRAGLVRLAVLFAGLLLLVGAGIAHAAEKLGTPWTLAAQYLGVMGIVWGLNGFFFRRLPLSRFTLPVFSAAAFGVLFLIGFFLKDVVGPFAIDSAGRFVGLVHLVDLIFYAFAFMAVAGAAGCAFSRNIIYSAWAMLFAFLGVAGLYVFLGADFPAVAQVLIYVGGILVLILFAIMLTKQIGEDPKLTNDHLGLPVGAALGVITLGTLTYMAVMAPWKLQPAPGYQPSRRWWAR